MPKSNVAVISLNDGISQLAGFAHRKEQSIDWSVLMETKEGYQVYERTYQPCYGEMRPYAKGNADNGPFEPELLPVSQRIVKKPSDLFAPFPEGTPIAVGVPLLGRSDGVDREAYNWAMEEIILNPDVSPWGGILKDFTIERDKNKNVTGIVIKDTTIDPTVMVNLFRKISQNFNTNTISVLRELFPETSKLAVFVLSQAIMLYYGSKDKFIWNTGTGYSHFWGQPNVDWGRIMNAEPLDLTDGGTFKQRYAYNRPQNDYIWGKGPKLAEVTKSVGEYPTKDHLKLALDYLTGLIKND